VTTGIVDRRLAGRCAVVTGAGGGIGSAISRRLGAEGARLVITDIHQAGLERTAADMQGDGSVVAALLADVADADSVAGLFGAAQARLGRIDILVNCAGIVFDEPVASTSLSDWCRVIDSNLTSIFLTCRQVIPLMTDAGYGRIVNVSSQLAISGASDHAAYAAAKAGVIALTKSIAKEVSPLGINANCVAPGPIDTSMLKRDGSGWTSQRVAQLPIRRVGEPHEVAGSVALLASEVDGALFTGQVLGPNSGDVM
jgi:3-oxoacyl-[acyl-carrier protein] reductase